MMDFAKMVRINNFIEMLHRGECMIDSKANDIPYDNGKTLAEFINYALQTYSNKLSIADSSTLNLAYSAIIAALSHGVVIKQHDLRKTIMDISARLQNCQSENAVLKSENASLIQQVKNLNTIKSQLEKELRRYQHHGINVD
jgi:predicted RNase H-like nuclease (RuvC/YqgF family)